MKIQVNTDRNIVGHEALAQGVEESVRDVLSRFSSQITRIEVHLSDENGTDKTFGADKRCLLEARLAGRQPSSVTASADSPEAAAKGAAQKMVRLLETELGRANGR